MGAVMYTEAGLGDSTLAKVSLRSVGDEDTTPISEVMLERERGQRGAACLLRERMSHWDTSLFESGIWRRRPQERQLLRYTEGRARGLEGVMLMFDGSHRFGSERITVQKNLRVSLYRELWAQESRDAF